MYEERRLQAAGIPLEDAALICCAMRKSGGLEEFVQREEERAKMQREEGLKCMA